MEIKELYLVVVSFSPWKSVESVGEKYNFAYVELTLNSIIDFAKNELINN